MNRRHWIWVLGLWAVVCFVTFAGRGKVVIDHEARVVQTAQVMLRSGAPWDAERVMVQMGEERAKVNPWLIPVFQGEIRLQKPPLPYWVTAGAFAVLGETEFAARLAPAALGGLGAVLVYALVMMTPRGVGGSRRTLALLAAGVWVSCQFLLDESRKAMVDPYLAFFTLAALVGHAGVVRRDLGRGAWVGSLVVLTVAMALGALSKGPVVFLHLGLGVGLYSWFTGRWPRVGRWEVGMYLAAVAVFLGMTLPWPVYVMKHVPHALELWRHESVGEFGENRRNARPWWFYLPYVPMLVLPWTVFTVMGAVAAVRRRRVGLGRFALAWMVGSVVVFSFAHMKKPAYLLPVMPGLVLLTAMGMAQALAWARVNAARRKAVAQVLFGHLVAGVGAAVAIGVMAVQMRKMGSEWPVVGIALVASVVALRAILRHRDWHEVRKAMALQVISFSILVFLFVSFPRADRDNRRAAIALTPELSTKESLSTRPVVERPTRRDK